MLVGGSKKCAFQVQLQFQRYLRGKLNTATNGQMLQCKNILVYWDEVGGSLTRYSNIRCKVGGEH